VFTNDKVRILYFVAYKDIGLVLWLYVKFLRAADERTSGGYRKDVENETRGFGEKNITASREGKQNLYDTIRV